MVFHVKVMLSLCFFGQVVLEVGLELAVLAHKRVLASFPCEQVPENEKFKEDFETGQRDDNSHMIMKVRNPHLVMPRLVSNMRRNSAVAE